MRIEVAGSYYPRLTRWHVRRALKWLSPAELAGLEFIRVQDEDTESPARGRGRSKKLGDVWARTANGCYERKHGRAGAHAKLFARDLYLGVPLLFKLTPVATLRIAFTLAHEVGHHLVNERGYIFSRREKYKPYGVYDEYEEGMCDRFALIVRRRMLGSRLYGLGDWLSRHLASWYAGLGDSKWGREQYEQAAFYWLCSFRHGRDIKVAELYDKALARLNSTRSKSS